MCGRFTLTTPGEILAFAFMVDEVEPAVTERLGERFNLCPTDEVPVVVGRRVAEGGGRKAGLCRWGLVPPWAKDPSIGSRMINARSETLADKPSFRRAFEKRRCVIPADGFFEWRREDGGGKTPLFIRRQDGEPLAFAGLWERWRDRSGGASDGGGDGLLRTCTIITGPPNGFMAGIHHRMPCILDEDGVAAWLDPDLRTPAAAQEVLSRRFASEQMEAWEVSTYVNKPGNEGARCLEPVAGGVSLRGTPDPDPGSS